jgi:hypothetical protein
MAQNNSKQTNSTINESRKDKLILILILMKIIILVNIIKIIYDQILLCIKN